MIANKINSSKINFIQVTKIITVMNLITTQMEKAKVIVKTFNQTVTAMKIKKIKCKKMMKMMKTIVAMVMTILWMKMKMMTIKICPINKSEKII